MEVLEIELSLLEEFSDSLKCEAVHKDGDCSVEVTHIASDCVRTGMICQNRMNKCRETLERSQAVCKKCNQHISVCWSFRPI